MIPPRPPIVGGSWTITCQLEVDGQPIGDPLTLRYADSHLAGGKPKGKKVGMPADVGYLVSLAIAERAAQLRSLAKRKKGK